MLNDTSIQAFKTSLSGEIIERHDPKYEDARKVYNGMINKYPRIIVYCLDVADVIQSVNFGRTNNLLISIRCGGHNAGGLGICDDCLVIDLSRIKNIRINPISTT